MVSTASTQGKSLIIAIIRKMSDIGVSQSKFITHILIMFLSIRGRINFINLGRYGQMDEHSYRHQFEKNFDWTGFNVNLIQSYCSDEVIIGFDPSHISKSGKHTHGVGYFYSGCNGRYEKGLEIGTFAAIDVKQNTAYHINAQQTEYMKNDRGENLITQYKKMFDKVEERLKQISNIMVLDAYFYKANFINHVVSKGMEMITRLRNDANLLYLYKGKQKGGRGRPKQFDGKVNLQNIDKRRFTKVELTDGVVIYESVVYNVSLKRNIKLAYVQIETEKKITTLLFMSTNLERSAVDIYRYYKSRYQMEFNFRDAKQFTGLEECQARDANKLNFHFNSSLSSINVAKIIQRVHCKNEENITYSISDIKTELSNQLMIDLILSKYGISVELNKNKIIYQELLNFGKRAA
jgi:hypothetical protein